MAEVDVFRCSTGAAAFLLLSRIVLFRGMLLKDQGHVLSRAELRCFLEVILVGLLNLLLLSDEGCIMQD